MIGAASLRVLADGVARIGDVVLLGGRTVASVPRRPPAGRDVLRELYVQGNRAFGLLLLMAGFAGLVLAYQFGQSLERFGARQYLGQLTALALTREMMPMLVALVLGGRIVAGIAAELASMTVTEQVDAVEALGADPVQRLVAPRVIAATLVLPLLTVLGDLIGMVTGMVVARVEFGVPARWYLVTVRDFLLVGDFMSGVAKAAVFGAVGALVACHAGLTARRSTAGVGQATTSAVVVASLAVIVVDYLLTRTFFSTTGVVR